MLILLVFCVVSKNKSKCQEKVVRYLLNITPRTHVGVNEFKYVNMLHVNYRVYQLKIASHV